VETGVGVLAMPRAGGLTAVTAGMGFLVGAGLPPVTGFLVYAGLAAGVLGAGAGRAFWPVLGAPTGLAPWALTCFVAATDGLGCIDAGKIFREALVT
jgi:hypothetical protein